MMGGSQKRSFGLMLMALLLFACTKPTQHTSYEEQKLLMGTLFRIKVFSEDNKEAKERFHKASWTAYEEIAKLENQMSEWRPHTPISQAIASAGIKPITITDELLTVLDVAAEISKLTDGVFDISFKPLANVWDWKTVTTLPSQKKIQNALKRVGYQSIVIDKSRKTLFLKRKGMQIGLGGIAKGYAAKKAGNIVRENGFANFIIDAGGDLYIEGTKDGSPWVTGIRNPDTGKGFIKRLSIKRNCAVATSGGYERFFELDGKRYHHILDLRTGHPSKGVKSVTVLAVDPTYADAMATAFFVLGVEKSQRIVAKRGDLAFVIVDDKDNVFESPNLKDFADSL